MAKEKLRKPKAAKHRVVADADAGKRIARAEKVAMKAGVDHGLIQRFWELVSLFPRITDPVVEARVEDFILKGTPGQYYIMQKAIFEEAAKYLVEDEKVMKVMRDLRGRKIGLAVMGEYESTITLDDLCLKVEMGIRDNIPVISVMTRRDYADAILRKKDPIKMLLGRKIRASHKLTLLRWVLPHLELFREKGLVEKYLSYQPELEQLLEENLRLMGY